MTALSENPAVALTAVPLLLLVLAPTAAMALRWAPRDWTWPPFFFSVIVFLGYLSPLPAFLDSRDLFSIEWPHLYRAFDDSLSLALLLAAYGTIGFYAGYALSALGPRPAPRGPACWSVTRLRIAGIVCTGFGLTLFSIGVVLLGGVQSLAMGLPDRTRAFAGLNYFMQATLLLPVFAVVWFAYLLTQGRLWTPWFVLYAVTAMGVGSLAGQKANIVIIIVTASVAFHRLYRRLPLRVLPLLMVGGLCVLALYDLYFREYLTLGGFVGDGPDVTLFDRLLPMVDRVLSGNFVQLQQLTALVDVVPDILPWQYGRSYLTLFTAPIPSSLWPDKPAFSAYDYTMALWPYRWVGEGTSMPPSLIGELYLNFGPWGMGIGMLLFGYLYGVAYRFMRARAHDPFAALWYGVLLGLMLHYVRGEFTAATVLLLLALTPLVMLRFLVIDYRADSRLAVLAPRVTDPATQQPTLGYGPARPP